MEACTSAAVAARTLRADQIEPESRTLSENVVEISTPPSAKCVKLDQLTSTPSVSDSTSANGLSANSTLSPFIRPLGFVAAGMSKGPVQVWPKSVDLWKHRV